MPQAAIRTRTPQYRLVARLVQLGYERMPDGLDWTLLCPHQFTVHWTMPGHTRVYARRSSLHEVDQFYFELCSLRTHSVQQTTMV